MSNTKKNQEVLVREKNRTDQNMKDYSEFHRELDRMNRGHKER